MKRQLRRWEIGGILCFVLLFIACEPESFTEPKSKNTTRIVSKTLSLGELQYESEVMEKLETLLPGFGTEMPYNEEHDFTINTDEVIYIEKGNQHSYTFSVIREEVVPGLENLILNYEQDNYTAYWIRYDFTAVQLAHPENLMSQETRVIITPFDPESSFMSRKRPNPCVKLEKVPVAWNDQGQITHSEWIKVIDQDCLDQLNSGGQTSSTASGDGGSNGGVSNGSWGGWMGTGVNTGVYDPPPATDNSGYTGGSSGGHSGGSGTSVFTLPNVSKITFANYIKKLKVSLRTVVLNPSWWHTTSGKRIVKYLQQHFDTKTGLIDIKASEFATWAIRYLVSHPEVTWEQFENWFMGEVEGNDGEYDSNFWDNPDLTFQQQQLPSFYAFNDAYPRIKGKELAQLIGGDILDLYTKYPNRVRGYCALKVSRALNYSGVTIPHVVTTKDNAGTVSGDDGKYYFLNAKALNKWMQKTFGISPDNPFHIRISGSEGGIKGENFPQLTEGLKGIYSMVAIDNIQETWASGHTDLINNSQCVFGCSFYIEKSQIMPVQYIDIWILN